MELAYTPLGKAYSPCINKGQMFQRWGEQEWQVVQQKGIWSLIGRCHGGQGHQWDETDHEKKKNNTYSKRRARKENGKGISRTHGAISRKEEISSVPAQTHAQMALSWSWGLEDRGLTPGSWLSPGQRAMVSLALELYPSGSIKADGISETIMQVVQTGIP